MMKTVSTLFVTLGILTGSGIASAYERGPAPPVAVHDYRTDNRNDNRNDRPDYRRPAPPAPRLERVRSRPGFVWIAGSYEFQHGRYVWQRGHFERVRHDRWSRR
jgi:hypothetical protein